MPGRRGSAPTFTGWSRKLSSLPIDECTDHSIRPLDTLSTCETASQISHAAPARYAIRQALDQEYQKFLIKRSNEARQARYKAGRAIGAEDEDDIDRAKQQQSNAEDKVKRAKSTAPKHDFFGRILVEVPRPSSTDGMCQTQQSRQHMSRLEGEAEDRKVWVSFHEGFSNAVRKPITLDELLRSF